VVIQELQTLNGILARAVLFIGDVFNWG